MKFTIDDDSNNDAVINTSTPTFSGSQSDGTATEPGGATVAIVIAGSSYQTTADANGDWSITIADSDKLRPEPRRLCLFRQVKPQQILSTR